MTLLRLPDLVQRATCSAHMKLRDHHAGLFWFNSTERDALAMAISSHLDGDVLVLPMWARTLRRWWWGSKRTVLVVRGFRLSGVEILVAVIFIALCTLLFLGCAHIPVEERLNAAHTRVDGPLLQKIVLSKRLLLFIKKEDTVVVAGARNEENSRLLGDLDRILELQINHDITVWGTPLTETSWDEFTMGVQLNVEAIAWEDPATGVVFIVNTRYGDRIRDRVDGSQVLKLLLNTGKKALK